MTEQKLILALLLREEWVDGKTLRQMVKGKLHCGAVYTHLGLLERSGAVEATREDRTPENAGRLLRRMYRITGGGLAMLARIA